MINMVRFLEENLNGHKQMGNFITEMEPIIVCQRKTLGNKIAEIKNASDGLIIRLHIPRERISETKYR